MTLFYDPLNKYFLENDEGAFRMPYKHYGRMDRENKLHKYANLKPYSTALKKRLIGTVYGGVSKK